MKKRDLKFSDKEEFKENKNKADAIADNLDFLPFLEADSVFTCV
jgi:hypothetical protein